MASPNMQIARNPRTQVADRVTSKVTDALKSDTAFESGSLALSARIAGAAAEAVLDLPAEARRTLTRRQAELVRGVRRLVETFGDELPGQILIIEPLAALDRIHEMPLDGVAGRERDVVTALHHAGAAAFAEQTFYRDGDVEIGVGFLRMQRRE